MTNQGACDKIMEAKIMEGMTGYGRTNQENASPCSMNTRSGFFLPAKPCPMGGEAFKKSVKSAARPWIPSARGLRKLRETMICERNGYEKKAAGGNLWRRNIRISKNTFSPLWIQRPMGIRNASCPILRSASGLSGICWIRSMGKGFHFAPCVRYWTKWNTAVRETRNC